MEIWIPFSSITLIFIFILGKIWHDRKSPIITVTITGGACFGSKHDAKMYINISDIKSLTKPYSGEIGNSVIVLNDGKRLYVSESIKELKKMTRR